MDANEKLGSIKMILATVLQEITYEKTHNAGNITAISGFERIEKRLNELLEML